MFYVKEVQAGINPVCSYKKRKKFTSDDKQLHCLKELERTRRWTVNSYIYGNVVAMVRKNIISLFPAVFLAFGLKVDNCKCFRKICNPCWKFLHEIISFQEFMKDYEGSGTSLSRVSSLTTNGEGGSPLLSFFIVYHLWVHLDLLLFPSFRLFFIPFPVRQDRSDEELDGWQAVLTLQG